MCASVSRAFAAEQPPLHWASPLRDTMSNHRRRALIVGLSSTLAAGLGFGGYLYPLLPTAIVAAWVERSIPPGTPYQHALDRVSAHGWDIVSGHGQCIVGEGGVRARVELGRLWLLLPAVSYAYAKLEFDNECRLASIKVEKETDAP
jgi:hypothetical protein